MIILNNLCDPIYINIHHGSDIENMEDKNLYQGKSNPVQAGDSKYFPTLDKDAIYITSYDSTKKIYRGNHVYIPNLNIDDPDSAKLEICEDVYGDFNFADMDRHTDFDPDFILGMSYVIPSYICYCYNISIFIGFIVIIAIAAAVLYLLLI